MTDIFNIYEEVKKIWPNKKIMVDIVTSYDKNKSYSHIVSVQLWGSGERGKKRIIGTFKAEEIAIDALMKFTKTANLNPYKTILLRHNISEDTFYYPDSFLKELFGSSPTYQVEFRGNSASGLGDSLVCRDLQSDSSPPP
jgi:hypothetical protein